MRTKKEPLYPCVTMTKNGKFSFSKKAIELLELDKNEGLMFTVNRKDKKIALFKENETDSFRLKKDRYSDNFLKSELLMSLVKECFRIQEEKKQDFLVKKNKDVFEILC